MNPECPACGARHSGEMPFAPGSGPVCGGCGRDLQWLVDQLETVAIVQYHLARRRSSDR